MNNDFYKIVLGDRGKSAGCLWHTRDRISHENHLIENIEYEEFKKAISWLIDELLKNLPENYEEAQKIFLNHKKKTLSNVSSQRQYSGS